MSVHPTLRYYPRTSSYPCPVFEFLVFIASRCPYTILWIGTNVFPSRIQFLFLKGSKEVTNASKGLERQDGGLVDWIAELKKFMEQVKENDERHDARLKSMESEFKSGLQRVESELKNVKNGKKPFECFLISVILQNYISRKTIIANS